jgi:hypothetical protein
MKGIKMGGLTPKISKLIQQLRVSELQDMAAFRMVLILCTTLAWVPKNIIPVVAFRAFIGI